MGGRVGGYSNYFELVVTNPASNPYAITEIVVTLPTGWAFSTSSPSGGVILDTCTSIGTMQSADCTSSGSGLVPGVSDTLDLDYAVGPEVSAPATVSIGVTVQSNGAFAPAPSLSAKVYPLDYDGSDSSQGAGATSYPAGSGAITFSSKWFYGSAADGSASHAAVGLPVYFNFFSSQYSGTVDTTYSGSFTPSSAVVNTNSTGVAAIKVQPSNTMSDTVYVDSNAGPWDTANGATYCNWNCWDSGLITTTNGAPTTVAFTSWTATHYVTAFGTPTWTGATGDWAEVASAGIAGQVKDSFGNTISSGVSGETCTITAFGGSFDNAGTQSSSNSVAAGASCSTAGVLASTLNYFQSGTFATTGYVQGTMTGTYNSVSFTAQGVSKNIVTSTFDSGASATPTASPTLPANVQAGKTVKLTYQLTNVQTGVPVTFLAINSTSPYLGSFVGGTAPTSTNDGNVTVNTDSTGKAVATFNVDTTAGSAATFAAFVAAPTDGSPSGTLSTSPATGAATTIAGVATGLKVTTYFETGPLANPTTTSLGGSTQTLYINVALVDAYGNTAINPGPAQIGVSLAVSSGAVTTSSPFIIASDSDTYTSFGSISWSFNAAVGSSITLTATATLPGATSPSTKTRTVSLVSPNPVLAINSPTGSPVYSKFPGVAFSGNVTLSAGYDPGTVTLAGVSFKIDNGAYNSLGTANPFATSAAFTTGLHTISFNASDSEGNPSNVVTLQVLVDTSAPDINFVTAANANISSPATVTASLVDTLGDLNSSSVSAVATNIDTSATSTLTAAVTGTNNPGHSVTYGVTLSGLTTGNWSIALSAADLAGNTNSSTLVVHVTVPLSQSFVVSGTPSIGTLGGYTGVNVNYQNLNPTSQSVVIFAVWKNSLGQTVGIGTSSATVPAGGTYNAFIVEPVGLASGTYTVNLFVVTTGNTPVSITTSFSASV